MMFEVETTASAAMANNATKVFSKTSDELEKPLFYFHIVLSASDENERVRNLSALFGKHNYRVYVLNHAMSPLAIDILTQHRRIRSTVDLRLVLRSFMAEAWGGIDNASLLSAVEKLRFRIPYLQIYGEMIPSLPLLKERYLSFLRSKIADSRHVMPYEVQYAEPFYGAEWVYPIHLGIVAKTTPERSDACFGLLKYWQLESSYMSQIGPHWGLSQDYDQFVAGASASLWTLLAALFIGVPGATQFISDQMMSVFSKLYQAADGFALFTAMWLLHVSALANDERCFGDAARYVNQHGIGLDLVKSPPAWISTDERDTWWLPSQGKSLPIPTMEEFSEHLRSWASSELDVFAEDTAITLLTRQPPADWERSIVRSLWISRSV